MSIHCQLMKSQPSAGIMMRSQWLIVLSAESADRRQKSEGPFKTNTLCVRNRSLPTVRILNGRKFGMHRKRLFVVMFHVILCPQLLSAEVVKCEIQSREPIADGYCFGPRKLAYEKLTGRLHLEVDPRHEANQRVTDLKLADADDRGRVTFWTEFCLLKPVDTGKGNRRLFYDVNNRGNKLALGAFNDAGNNRNAAEDPGNGFLMRLGYSVLWCGWNGDVRPGNGRLLIDLPAARENGKPITGKIYAEISVNSKSFSQPFYWGNSNSYPAVSTDKRLAKLTVRPDRQSPAVAIPEGEWEFARFEGGKSVPDLKHLYLKDGFQPGMLYDLIYTGIDPRVTGLGFAAVRDAISFFKHAEGETANPLSAAIDKAYIFGISQSGRFTHHFLYDGFNTDEQNRIVFDAAMPHVGGGGKGQFNFRFAQTTRHGSQHEDLLFPSDFFPFNTVPQTDPHSGKTADSFARARAKGHLPKIFFTETSTEYWCRAASLLHTDVDGTKDAAVDPNVRIYFFTGAQHGNSSSSNRGIYQNERNTLDHRPLLRALLVALDAWVSTGKEPPASTYPRIDDGTLIDLKTWKNQFPRLPNSNVPRVVYTPLRLDPGPRWESLGIADNVPPKILEPSFRTLVPAIDRDGNEVAGIKLPGVSVPLATYSGWNLRGKDCGAKDMLARWTGSQWPLPRTAKQRRNTDDPRRSIHERFPTQAAYVGKVRDAASRLQEQRFLLAEDVDRIIRKAESREFWDDE